MKWFQRGVLGAILFVCHGWLCAAETPAPVGDARVLVVLFHGFAQGSKPMPLMEALLNDKEAGPFKNATVLPLQLPFDTFSTANPETVVSQAIQKINTAWTEAKKANSPFGRVILVGHSMGAVYARRVYVVACGDPVEGHGGPAAVPVRRARVEDWAAHVDRLVLTAGMNRGWTIDHHLDLWRSTWMSAGTMLGEMLVLVGKTPIVFSVRRGAPFLTELRLQWLVMRRMADMPQPLAEGSYERAPQRCHANPPLGGACVVQLLGTQDDLVPPEDNIDWVTGSDFIYLEVPHSGHANVVEMVVSNRVCPTRPEEDRLLCERRKARGERFVWAMTETSFGSASQPLGQKLKPDHAIKDVVFVMHGIRDEGYWTEKIARRVLNKAAQGSPPGEKPTLVTETSSYGYFPMLSFLRPGMRQEKVEWFMDKYTAAKALYPNAEFSYVGHSNGTYLLKKALEDYQSVRFKNVVFAGSVVRKDFDWAKYRVKERERVKAVANFTATADWVVAWFPNALQELDLQDLGSAGHDGFSTAADMNKARVIGGHGAAVSEMAWDGIADFILTGVYTPSTELLKNDKVDSWVRYPAYAAWLIWALLGFGAYKLLRVLLALRIREWVKTLAVIGYAGLLLAVLTRF